MKHFVYILESLKNGKYYIGYSSDAEKRLRVHNQGITKPKINMSIGNILKKIRDPKNSA